MEGVKGKAMYRTMLVEDSCIYKVWSYILYDKLVAKKWVSDAYDGHKIAYYTSHSSTAEEYIVKNCSTYCIIIRSAIGDTSNDKKNAALTSHPPDAT